MQRFSRSVLLAIVLACVPARGEPTAGPFANVPANDPAYAAVQRLSDEGLFTGYPNGTFNGHRALTRYEFAIAIQRQCQEATRTRGSAAASYNTPLRQAVVRYVMARVSLPETEQANDLAALVNEFRQEVAMLGGNPAAILDQLTRRPETAESPVPPRPEHESHSVISARELARREWEAGRVMLYAHERFGPPYLDPLLAVPLHLTRAAFELDQETRRKIEAHNDEVYRLVLERGLPPNARFRWRSLLQHPDRATGTSTIRMRLSPQAIAGQIREFTISVRRPSDDRGRLYLRSRSWTHELTVEWTGASTLELFAGPAESELLFLRVSGETTPCSIVDLRCGELLR